MPAHKSTHSPIMAWHDCSCNIMQHSADWCHQRSLDSIAHSVRHLLPQGGLQSVGAYQSIAPASKSMHPREWVHIYSTCSQEQALTQNTICNRVNATESCLTADVSEAESSPPCWHARVTTDTQKQRQQHMQAYGEHVMRCSASAAHNKTNLSTK